MRLCQHFAKKKLENQVVNKSRNEVHEDRKKSESVQDNAHDRVQDKNQVLKHILEKSVRKKSEENVREVQNFTDSVADISVQQCVQGANSGSHDKSLFRDKVRVRECILDISDVTKIVGAVQEEEDLSDLNEAFNDSLEKALEQCVQEEVKANCYQVSRVLDFPAKEIALTDEIVEEQDIIDVVSETPVPQLGQTEHENIFLRNYFNPPEQIQFPFHQDTIS